MSAPKRLASAVAVREHYLRSAHLEHHSGETAAAYIPTARALEVLRRITRSMTRGDTGRAWTLTGPYGTGKSSFALFLHALLGPDRDGARRAAEERLRDADPLLAAQLSEARNSIACDGRGFVRATVTAAREPIVETVARALAVGATERWQRNMPPAVRTAIRIAEHELTPRSILQALEYLCEYAPVLVAVDEFGKNLEHVSTDPAAADLFLLQELAERATGRRALPVFIVTLQHLAFDDYVQGASAVQRGEWGKIQGRFEDIPFVETAEQSLRLVAGAFDTSGAPRGFASTRAAWAKREHATCQKLGLARLIPGGQPSLEACYPLHPLTLLALPEMCARFGQNGRTLFSFLTSREPHSVANFLGAAPLTAELPSVPVDQVYDFFLASGAATVTRQGVRLTEIDQALRESTGLTHDEQRILKVIGVLNLLSQGGPLRASLPLLRYSLADTTLTDRKIRGLVEGLQARGVLTYRTFADEYRIWQGSDLDLAALVNLAREEQATLSPAELVTEQVSLPAAIAGRHSQDVGMLRYFRATFADAASPSIRRPEISDDPDGLLVYYLGNPDVAESLPITDGDKPVVVATTTRYAAIVEAVRELAAARAVLTRIDVQSDRVARREMQDRASEARRRLDAAIASALRPGMPGVELRLVGAKDALPANRSLSGLLSDVCDAAYSASPRIRNEMLGRRELTSQGAKARRELLTAMVDHAGETDLGLVGNGPEKAMYAAMLRRPGIYRLEDDSLGFHPPLADKLMLEVWRRLNQVIDRASDRAVGVDAIYRMLMAPPIGLKEGPVPVLLTALLLHRSEDVALFQDGTYQPRISSELLERLVKTPDRFAIKHVALSAARSRVLAAVHGVLPGRVAGEERNASVLNVAAPLLTTIRALPSYTLRTSALTAHTIAVRDVLLNAREPDEMLFTMLPTACGFAPFRPTGRGGDPNAFATALRTAIDEMHGAYSALLERCVATLGRTVGMLRADLPAMRAGLRARAETLIGTLLEPRLRSFTLIATDTELDDDAWLEALLNNLVSRPPANWRDEDAARFDIECREVLGLFTRVLALHYDQAAAAHDGFDAHRVSVTNPSGVEQSNVVWVDHAAVPQVTPIADAALAAVERLLGPHGGEALLAILAGRILGTSTQTETTAPDVTAVKRSRRRG